MTIKEIARMAGVSISTVSKIMNHKDASISAETRERVLRIAREFNYSPYSNTLAVPGKTFILGALICSCEANRTLSGILEAARSQGYTVLVAQSGGEAEAEESAVRALCRHHVDAILWEPVSEDSLRHSDIFRASRIPFLIFNVLGAEGSFNLNFEQMGYEAANSLVTAHHRNIACLLSPGRRTEQFLEGYKKCLFRAGIPFQDNLIFREINDTLLHGITTHSITGIVSSHLACALRLYENLNHLHYYIPYDAALVSLRNDAQENMDFPRISTITIPYFEFGRHLCRSLIKNIEQGDTIPDFETAISLDSASSIQLPFDHQKKSLTVVGSINIDSYLKVEELPVTGRTVLTTNSALYPGGKGLNQAVGAALLGARVTLIGAVGDDVDSNLIFSSLEKHSIESGNVRRRPNCATGKAFIFVQPDGNSMISILSGANDSLRPEDVLRSEHTFENTGYCLIQTEVPQQTLIQAGKLARKYGAKTILKPSACSALDPELLKYVDIIVPNLNEINILCPGKNLSAQADALLDTGIETVIITMGEKGCYLKTEQHEEYFPAHEFTTVDNTGAGDAFICALAVYLQKGCSMQDSIKIAAYAAGFSISREGATPALVDRNTLESYIRQNEPELLPKSGG